MGENRAFEEQVDHALANYGRFLGESHVPEIKANLQRMKSSFDSIHALLKKLGLLRQDPYHYEEHVSEIAPPPDDEFLESELDLVVGVRMAKYEVMFDYVINYTHFSLEALDLLQLKKLSQFVNYFGWRNFSETSAKPTTRGMAMLVGKITSQKDPLSTDIVSDAKEQLAKLSGSVNSSLKKVAAYQRERYKLAFRQEVIPELKLGDRPDESQSEAVLRRCRPVVARAMPGQPIVRDLVLEVLTENGTDNAAETARDEVLRALPAPDPNLGKEEKTIDIKPILLEAARTFASSSTALERAVKKLNENIFLIEDRKLSFGEVLHKIWDRMRGRDQTSRVYRIEYVDQETTARHTEEVDFDDFVAKATRRARVYSGFLSKMGSGWTKLESSTEERLLDFVTEEHTELHLTARRMRSLETFFKSELTHDERKQFSSTKEEIDTIADSVTRGQRRISEYTAKKEEIAQLRKLGITPAVSF